MNIRNKEFLRLFLIILIAFGVLYYIVILKETISALENKNIIGTYVSEYNNPTEITYFSFTSSGTYIISGGSNHLIIEGEYTQLDNGTLILINDNTKTWGIASGQKLYYYDLKNDRVVYYSKYDNVPSIVGKIE